MKRLVLKGLRKLLPLYALERTAMEYLSTHMTGIVKAFQKWFKNVR
jgi:hypothetical protein